MHSTQTDQLLLRIALSRMTFLSCGEKIQLLKKLDNVSELALLSKEELERMFGRALKGRFWNREQVVLRAERDLRLMEQYGISLVIFGDAAYPQLLNEIVPPPFALYYRGDISCLNQPCLAIVGTRHADAAGLKAAYQSARHVAARGITVVSGLAAGIDGAAHRGALEAVLGDGSPGKTAALLGSGVDIIYPSAHKRLASAILRGGGCLLSEYPPEEQARPYHFPVRDRLISGVASGVLVIEAPEKSGALITVDFAIEQNRDVWFHSAAVPYAQRDAAERHREDTDVFTCPAGVLRYIEEGAPVVDGMEAVCAEILSVKQDELTLF